MGKPIWRLEKHWKRLGITWLQRRHLNLKVQILLIDLHFLSIIIDLPSYNFLWFYVVHLICYWRILDEPTNYFFISDSQIFLSSFGGKYNCSCIILFDSIWVVLAWDLAVCSYQGLRFNPPRCQSWWASPYRTLLWV